MGHGHFDIRDLETKLYDLKLLLRVSAMKSSGAISHLNIELESEVSEAVSLLFMLGLCDEYPCRNRCT